MRPTRPADPMPSSVARSNALDGPAQRRDEWCVARRPHSPLRIRCHRKTPVHGLRRGDHRSHTCDWLLLSAMRRLATRGDTAKPRHAHAPRRAKEDARSAGWAADKLPRDEAEVVAEACVRLGKVQACALPERLGGARVSSKGPERGGRRRRRGRQRR